MFHKGSIYTHSRMVDAAIKIHGATKVENGDWLLSVRWMNRRGLDLGINDEFYVSVKELGNWYLL